MRKAWYNAKRSGGEEERLCPKKAQAITKRQWSLSSLEERAPSVFIGEYVALQSRE